MLRLVYSAVRPKSRSLDDEALEWVVKLTSGENSPEDQDAFRLWRDQSPDHLAALVRARTLWQQLGGVLDESRRPAPGLRTRQKWAIGFAAAASLAFCTIQGLSYWHSGRFDQVTGVGEQKALALPDGSRITMSGDTALDVTSEAGLRRIKLVRGKIFVEARHDPTHPLVINAGNANFRDIGTVFAISRREEGEHLVVAQGEVEASRGDQRLEVRENQSVVVDKTLGQLHWADASADTAWVRGRLILHGYSLPRLIEELRPYYRGRIVMVPPASDQRLDADIDLGHIDSWLDAVAQMQGLRIRRIAGLTILT